MIYTTNQSDFMKKSLMLVVFSLLLSVITFAQSGTSSISGSVTDPQGNAIPGATVTIISSQNARRTTTTSENGNFSFPGIPTGTYKLEVEGKGFKKSVVEAIQAAVDKPTQLDVKLEVGGLTEVVTVNANSIENIVNTTDASLGNNFQSQQILDLPLQGRNVGNLLSLQAAVTPDGSVSGSRSDQANITLDGVDVNEQVNGAAFTPVLRVTPDSVEEFRVTTQNSDASKGRSSGAQISLITKAGTNDFSGALYEYYRSSGFTSNDFFANKAGRFTATDAAVINGKAKVGDLKTPRPSLIRHLFGGRLGGPIIKDKLFFFYNYEGMRETKSSLVTRTVPLASLGQGILKFRDAGNNLITLTTAQINALTGPASLGSPQVVDVNPAVVSYLASIAAKYPANSNEAGDGLNTGGFQFNSPTPIKNNTHTARFDWNLNDSHSVWVRGNYQNDLTVGVSRFPDTPGTNRWDHPIGFAAKHTWIISSNITNTINYGFTRNAFSIQGDSSQNQIGFGNVYPIFQPFSYARTFNRTTPVHNVTDDVSWVKGNHTIQFGVNFRFVKNRTTNFARAFDNAFFNETFYATSGSFHPQAPVLAAGYTIRTSDVNTVRGVLTTLWGRYTQYTANYNFNLDGTAQASGTGITREFAAEEYDGYVQDIWKARSNLTITAGLRYGISMPIRETQGFETKTNIPLAEYFRRRVAASYEGRNYEEPLKVILSGEANNAGRLYPIDKNNLQPRVAVAWSPKFESGFLGKLFGNEQETVFRGGLAIVNDYFGQALALTWDANNTLGFSASSNINFATFTIYESGCTVASNCNPGPLFTGLGQQIKGLPRLTVPLAAKFPQEYPLDFSQRIQGSLDTELVSPINYAWNFSVGRKLPKGMYVEGSYVGRLGRNLLASRDVMQPNNIRDPRSGQTWYEAAQILEFHRLNQTPISQIPNQPFFENMYAAGTIDGIYFGAGLSNTRAAYAVMSGTTGATAPDCGAIGGCYGYGIDWTYLQDELDRYSGKTLFYQRQYGALASFGTIGNSDYHGATLSVRQRLKGLTWDLNYTFSKSMDDASGLQNAATFGTSSFILNALLQKDFRSYSDFDLRHIVNLNSTWDIPIGKDRTFFNDLPKVAEAILGGWQLTSIFRYNTGYPFSLSGVGGWPTNWNRYSYVVRLKDIQTRGTPTDVTFTGQVNGNPNNFANPQTAYNSFRSPAPGESGDRNHLRFPSYVVLDMGLQKSFNAPWKEGHKFNLRAEVFNVTNTQRLTGFGVGSLSQDPQKGNVPTNWGNFTNTQGPVNQGGIRIMQFALRYDF